MERASTGAERVLPVADVDPATVPYFSMIIVPGRDRRADTAGRAESPDRCAAEPATATPAELFVVGLGPGTGSLADPGGRRRAGRG